MIRRFGAAALVLACLGLTAGCGGDDEPAGASNASSPSAASTSAPPAPTVVLSKGTPCGGGGGGDCGGSCTDPTCAKVKLVVTGLADEVTCQLESNAPGARFPELTVAGTSESEPGWFMGYPGKTVTARCAGVLSAPLTWS